VLDHGDACFIASAKIGPTKGEARLGSDTPTRVSPPPTELNPSAAECGTERISAPDGATAIVSAVKRKSQRVKAGFRPCNCFRKMKTTSEQT
jgi:hypothetical protein